MMNSLNKKKKTKLWQRPWGYKESFLIALDLLILSFILEIAFHTTSGFIPSLPWSIILFLFVIFGIALITVFYKDSKTVKWLSSVPAAVASISLFFTISLFLGLFPQGENSVNTLLSTLGLTNIMTSWPMFFAMLFLLATLGFTAFKRIFPFKKKNIGFLLNHFGLWIVLAAAAIGANDLQRFKMQLFENNEFSNVVVDDSQNMYKLPFEVKLISFDIDEYNPKLLLFNPETEQYIYKAGKSFQMISKDYQTQFDGYKLKVLDFIKYAQLTDSGYFETSKPFATPASLIEIEYPNNEKKTQNWITSGGFGQAANIMKLNPNIAITLSMPEPKEYSSLLAIKHGIGTIDTIKVVVNKPFKIEGYRLYQLNYDNKLGKWSNYSVIEIVSDPWLPIVYTGLAILMIGALFMVWWGRKIYITPNIDTINADKNTSN